MTIGPIRVRTHFASPERASRDYLARLREEASNDPNIELLTQVVPGYLVLVDSHRQVFACNEEIRRALSLDENRLYVGPRPGELLKCDHVKEGPGGCGTSIHCRKCGLLLTVLAAQERNRPTDGECTLARTRDGVTEETNFAIRCTPILLAGEPVTAVVLRDITEAKRREILDQLFMHDVKSVIQGLMGYGELLCEKNVERAARMIVSLASQLNELFDSQSLLRKVEAGTLTATPAIVDAGEIIQQLQKTFNVHTAAYGKTLETRVLSEDTKLFTDIRLLLRVVISMVMYALEVVPRGGDVVATFERRANRPTFTVWHAGALPAAIASNLFSRQAATAHADGYGLGTYGMKILSENYLAGEIAFTTSEEEGTTFLLMLPEELDPRAPAFLAHPPSHP